jgi:hypothetical protein
MYVVADEEIDKTKSARQELESARKEMGLEWMVRPSERPPSAKQILKDEEPSQDMLEEVSIPAFDLSFFITLQLAV